MPRKLRIHVDHAFYHVTLRGNHREPIFFSSADHQLLNDSIERGLAQTDASIHAYCWMSNHLHLLVQVGETSLGKLMLRVASRFARAVQRSIPTTGHLFENRYHDVLIQSDAQLLATLRYIHLNPVEAGLVVAPGDYEWTSHHAYLGQRCEPWLTTRRLLEVMGDSPTRAFAAYRALMNATEKHAAETTSDARIEKQRLLLPPPAGTVPVGDQSTVDSVTAEAIARFGVTREALLSRSKSRALSGARQWIARTAIERGAGSLSAIALALGRDESSLRKALARDSAANPRNPRPGTL